MTRRILSVITYTYISIIYLYLSIYLYLYIKVLLGFEFGRVPSALWL
jgi:hypothetical protein